MKVAVFVALLALVVLAAAVTSPKLTMGKFPRKPLTMHQASALAAGNGVPLKGNIPDYGEYVLLSALFCTITALLLCLSSISRLLEASAVPGAAQMTPRLEVSLEPFTRGFWPSRAISGGITQRILTI